MINEVKTRMYEVEEDVERRIEKARNEVEDMWERRWKEFEGVLRGGLGGGGSGRNEEGGPGGGSVDRVKHERKDGSGSGDLEEGVRVVWQEEEE